MSFLFLFKLLKRQLTCLLFKKVKIMDVLSSNSGNTFQKTINFTFNLYSSCKNDTVLVKYGDSASQTLNLYSGNLKLKN